MSDQPATKQDVAEIVTQATDKLATDLGTQISELAKMVGGEFKKVDKRFDNIEDCLERVERKLDPTIERVDNHSIAIKKLKQKTA